MEYKLINGEYFLLLHMEVLSENQESNSEGQTVCLRTRLMHQRLTLTLKEQLSYYRWGGYPVQRLLSGSITTDAENEICLRGHSPNSHVRNVASMYLPACARCGGSYGCSPV